MPRAFRKAENRTRRCRWNRRRDRLFARRTKEGTDEYPGYRIQTEKNRLFRVRHGRYPRGSDHPVPGRGHGLHGRGLDHDRLQSFDEVPRVLGRFLSAGVRGVLHLFLQASLQPETLSETPWRCGCSSLLQRRSGYLRRNCARNRGVVHRLGDAERSGQRPGGTLQDRGLQHRRLGHLAAHGGQRHPHLSMDDHRRIDWGLRPSFFQIPDNGRETDPVRG